MFGCFTIQFSVFYFDVLIGNRRNKSNKHASAVSEVDKVEDVSGKFCLFSYYILWCWFSIRYVIYLLL